ncbi:MAG: YeeE/YedE family protein [Alphaproteobacteria bacterium]|nr:YeeE/YedE family protein [Alphaproteobacteria bacterium]
MARIVAALACGLIFGVGLAISGMVNPAKVLGFLDFTGRWDPSLALVMAGGLVVYTLAFPLVRRKAKPLLADAFQLPSRRDIDPRLVVGAALFGVGWGLAGFCPGPALTALPFGFHKVYIFVGAMIAGSLAFGLWERFRK